MERLFIITGWTGLIGGCLVEYLVSQSKRVCLVEFNDRSNSRTFKDVEYVNELELNKIDNISENSILIHTAYNANASSCMNNPVSAVDSNINLTIKVLELCKKFNINEFLFLSTGFLYGEGDRKAHLETDQIIVNNLYLGTKYISEEIIKNYSKNYKIKSLILRLGNVFGSESSEKTVIGRILNQLNSGATEIKLLSLRASRDFIYIKDVVEAIGVVSKDKLVDMTNVLNVSSGTETSIKKLSETICALADSPLSIIEERSQVKSYNSTLLLDISKIEKLYKWKPKYTLHNALKEILNL